MVQVNVKTNDGKDVFLNLDSSCVLVKDVRKAIHKKLMAPLNQIHIMMGGRELTDLENIYDLSADLSRIENSCSSCIRIDIFIPIELRQGNVDSLIVYVDGRTLIFSLGVFRTILDLKLGICCHGQKVPVFVKNSLVNKDFKDRESQYYLETHQLRPLEDLRIVCKSLSATCPGIKDDLDDDFLLENLPEVGKETKRRVVVISRSDMMDNELVEQFDQYEYRNVLLHWEKKCKEYTTKYLNKKILMIYSASRVESHNRRKFKYSGVSYIENFLDYYKGRCKRYDSYSFYGVNLEDIKIGELLGSGSNGEVYSCSFVESPEMDYAIKKLWDCGATATVMEDSTTEQLVHSMFPHENIARVVTFFEDKTINKSELEKKVGKGKTTYYVLDKYDMTLEDRLKLLKDKKEKLSPRGILLIALQLFKCISHLVKNDISHRDIKTSDIMFSSNDYLHLIDFGCATRKLKTSSRNGLIKGRAPEILMSEPGTEIDHSKADVWSVGIMLLNCLNMPNPFFSSGLMRVCFEDVGKEYNSILKLVMSCLEISQSSRISPEEAIEYIEMILWPIKDQKDYQTQCEVLVKIMKNRVSSKPDFPFGVFENVEEKLYVQYLLKKCDSININSFNNYSLCIKGSHSSKELRKDLIGMGYGRERVKKCLRYMRKSSKSMVVINDVLDLLDDVNKKFEISENIVDVLFNTKIRKLNYSKTMRIESAKRKRELLLNSSIYDFRVIRNIGISDGRREGVESIVYLVQHLMGGDYYVLKILLNASAEIEASNRLQERFISEFDLSSSKNVPMVLKSDSDSDSEETGEEEEENGKVGKLEEKQNTVEFFHENIISVLGSFNFDLVIKILPGWPKEPYYNPVREGGKGSNRTCAVILEPYHMSLKQFIMGDRTRNKKTIAYILLQLCSACIYMEEHWKIHGDIKPANVLVKDEMIPKVVLTDFGCQFWCPNLKFQKFMLYSKYGNTAYKAPEMFGEDKNMNYVDVSKGTLWACALMGLEMLVGCYPFSEELLGKSCPKAMDNDGKYDIRKFRDKHLDLVLKGDDSSLAHILRCLLKKRIKKRTSNIEAWLILNNFLFGPFEVKGDKVDFKLLNVEEVKKWSRNEILDTHNPWCIEYISFLRGNEISVVDVVKKFYLE